MSIVKQMLCKRGIITVIYFQNVVHVRYIWCKTGAGLTYTHTHTHTYIYIYIYIYRVSQEECARLWESVPYVKLYRYNQNTYIQS